MTATMPAPPAAGQREVLRVAAGSVAELDAQLAAVGSARGGLGGIPADVAPCGQVRIGVIDPTPDRVALARKVLAKGKRWRGRKDVWFSPDPLLAVGGVAVVFPGLEADFAPRIDDVAAFVGRYPPELATGTLGRYAAAVLAVDDLLDAALRKLDVLPDAVAGHSIGEWAAMIAGGMIDRGDFAAMMARADLDALQVPGIEFAVMGCPQERAAAELARVDGVVISHENSTNQTVVCGQAKQVGVVVQRLRAAGVICQPLPFRSGFHTPMLEPYLEPFKAAGVPSLPIRPAAVPVWSATTARPFPDDEPTARELCVRHLLEPVRFRSLVLALHRAGMRVFVTAGPGQLGSLIDDTLRGQDHVTIAANVAHRSGIDQLLRVATAVWVEGGTPRFDVLGPAPDSLVQDSPAVTPLREVARWHPLAAHFSAVLDDAAASVAAVIAAATPARADGPVWPPRTEPLEVSTAAMPYLLDHCLAAQRPGWPDDSDRRPVMPATTMVAHMVDAALRSPAAAHGDVVTEVADIHFRRWLVAAPTTRTEVEVRPTDEGRVAVRLGEYADAVVTLAAGYGEPLAAWSPPAGEQVPALSAGQLYGQRWMFHGPSFRGITRAVAISANGYRSEITVGHPPGVLLDNVGHIIGQWLVERHPQRCIAFPAHIQRIRFHGAQPPPGDVVTGEVRVTSLSDDAVVVDAQVCRDGKGLISISGWRDYRVDGDATACAVHRHVERHTIATRMPGGWWACWPAWRSIASREFFMPKYLTAAERDEYARVPPPERTGWLQRRILVKDAVRGSLARPVYPAELAVSQPSGGQYSVTGQHGRTVPALRVAARQCRELAVAVVAEGGRPAAIDIAEVGEASMAVRNDISRRDERLLDGMRRATDDPLPSSLARMGVARTVAAHMSGEVIDVAGADFIVALDAARTARVHTAVVASPEGLPGRRHAIAWHGTEETEERP